MLKVLVEIILSEFTSVTSEVTKLEIYSPVSFLLHAAYTLKKIKERIIAIICFVLNNFFIFILPIKAKK